MTHTPECQERLALQVAAARQWLAAWPHHCPSCGGRGMFTYPETRDDPGGWEPCEACAGQGKCGRCGVEEALPEELESPCRFCGWDIFEGYPELDYCPGDCVEPVEARYERLQSEYPPGHCQSCGKPNEAVICNDCLVRSDEAYDMMRERRHLR